MKSPLRHTINAALPRIVHPRTWDCRSRISVKSKSNSVGDGGKRRDDVRLDCVHGRHECMDTALRRALSTGCVSDALRQTARLCATRPYQLATPGSRRAWRSAQRAGTSISPTEMTRRFYRSWLPWLSLAGGKIGKRSCRAKKQTSLSDGRNHEKDWFKSRSAAIHVHSLLDELPT